MQNPPKYLGRPPKLAASGMHDQPKRRGRPLKPAPSGKKASLGLKVTGEIKERLEESAARKGRSQSQEAEFRLEQSFMLEDLLSSVLTLAYGKHLAALLMMIGGVADALGPSVAVTHLDASQGPLIRSRLQENWITDPHAYREVAEAIDMVLDALRPNESDFQGWESEVTKQLEASEWKTQTVKTMLDGVMGKPVPPIADFQRIREMLGECMKDAVEDAVDRAFAPTVDSEKRK